MRCALRRFTHVTDEINILFVRAPRHIDARDIHLMRDECLNSRAPLVDGPSVAIIVCVRSCSWRFVRREEEGKVQDVGFRDVGLMRSPLFSNTLWESYRTIRSSIGMRASRSLRFEPRSTMAPAVLAVVSLTGGERGEYLPARQYIEGNERHVSVAPASDPAPFGGTARRGSPPNIIIEPGAAAAFMARSTLSGAPYGSHAVRAPRSRAHAAVSAMAVSAARSRR